MKSYFGAFSHCNMIFEPISQLSEYRNEKSRPLADGSI